MIFVYSPYARDESVLVWRRKDLHQSFTKSWDENWPGFFVFQISKDLEISSAFLSIRFGFFLLVIQFFKKSAKFLKEKNWLSTVGVFVE